MPTEFLRLVETYVRLNSSTEQEEEDLNLDNSVGRVRFRYNNKKVRVDEFENGVVEINFWDGGLLAGRSDKRVKYSVDSDAKEVAEKINNFFT